METKQSKDENALATIRNIFAAKTRDFITAIDDSGIIILRELQPSEDYSDLDDIAHMLVDMLNTEAMTSAWVSYSNIADDLKQLPDAYKEARTALEAVSYTHLGDKLVNINPFHIFCVYVLSQRSKGSSHIWRATGNSKPFLPYRFHMLHVSVLCAKFRNHLKRCV